MLPPHMVIAKAFSGLAFWHPLVTTTHTAMSSQRQPQKEHSVLRIMPWIYNVAKLFFDLQNRASVASTLTSTPLK